MLTDSQITKATKLTIPKYYYNQLPQNYRGNLLRTIKVKETAKNKVKITRYSDFVSIQTINLTYLSYGIKATVKVDTNYRKPYQYTLYFDTYGTIINSTENGLSDRQKFTNLKNN